MSDRSNWKAGDDRPTVFVLGLRGFPNVQGGVESHAQQLYPLVCERGVRVVCATRKRFHPPGMERWNGVEFVPIWAPRSQYLEAVVHSLLAVLRAAWLRPDLVHIHAVGPALVTPVARLLGLKVVITHHGPDYDREKWNRIARWVLRAGEWAGMKFSTRRIVISEVIAEIVRKRYRKSSDVIPNGVPIPTLDADRRYLEEYALTEGKYVLLVSRFVPEKRHLDLIEAFSSARLDGWKLVLAGDADHTSEYERRLKNTARNTANVVLTGFVGGEKLKAIYQHAGIFVLPSSHEGLPISLLEALSFGLRSVASDIPANLAVGLSAAAYFGLGDIDALSSKLKDLAASNWTVEDRERVRRWTRDKYNWEDIADRTVATYQSAFGKS